MERVKQGIADVSLKIMIIIGLFLSNVSIAYSQQPVFTLQDSLRGSITPERAWWDLTYYHLNLKADPGDSTISGNVLIRYRVLKSSRVMQIDLQQPLEITQVLQDGRSVEYERLGHVYYFLFSEDQPVGAMKEVNVFYAGRPKVSKHPPWDGGLVWSYDGQGNPFVATACQGAGASL